MWQQRLFTLGGCVCGGGSLATVAVLATGVAGAVRLPIAVAAGAVGVAVGGAVANRADEPAIRRFQGELRPVLVLFTPSAVVIAAALAVHATIPDAGGFWPAMAGTFLTIGGTGAMSHAAERLHVDLLEAETTHTARLPGRFTEFHRRYGTWIVLCGVGFALLYAGLVWVTAERFIMLVSGLSLLGVTYNFVRNSEQVVVSEGLVNGVSVTPWDNFEGFELTDDKLVLHIDGWNRERREFPQDEIADVRAVTYALSQYLRPTEKEYV